MSVKPLNILKVIHQYIKQISYIYILFISIFSTNLYSLNLIDVCKQALIDIEQLRNDSNEYIKTAESQNYKDKLAEIQNNWTQKVSEDECATGGCDLDSQGLKTSIVITLINGLSAKLVTLSDRQSIQELQQIVETTTDNKSIFTETIDKINNFCPNSPDEQANTSKISSIPRSSTEPS